MINNLLSLIAREITSRDKDKKKKEEFPGDSPAVTHHVINVRGKNIPYKATAGYLKMKDENQKLKTRFFYISYEREDVLDKTKRPLTFAFNGGPGAASAWVHFGAMGPKRIKMTHEGLVHPPPYEFVNNEFTWLDFTDLVFLDPIGTGYSIPEKDEDPEQFYGVEEDIKWAGDFIRLYISKNKRWLSPKYIAGESYGTFRAGGLSSYLQEKYAMDFNGIVLISSALNYITFDFGSGNDLPYLLFLPSYTAVAWYHNRLDDELQKDLYKTLREVEDWVQNEYCVILMKGDSISKEERDKVIKKLARYTSLPEDYIDKCNLRVTASRFRKKLLEDERKVVGLYDGRLKAVDIDPAGESPKTDPSMFNIYSSCIATLNAYLRNEMKYENDMPYKPLCKIVGELWNWNSGFDKMGYVDVTQKMLNTLSYNKYFNIFFAQGYYDLCTPYFMARYIADHLGLAPELKDNIGLGFYEAGHMMYVHMPSRERLFNDLKKFYGICERYKEEVEE